MLWAIRARDGRSPHAPGARGPGAPAGTLGAGTGRGPEGNHTAASGPDPTRMGPPHPRGGSAPGGTAGLGAWSAAGPRLGGWRARARRIPNS